MHGKEKDEIRTLKAFLLSSIPTTPLPPNDVLLSPNSVALKAAIAGLDKELARLEREEKLVKKFTASSEAAAVQKAGKEEDADMEYVQMSKEDAAGDVKMGGGEKDEEEWEEAHPSPAKKPHTDGQSDDTAELCQKLASAAVARIASANVKVSTPLGALALALHAALVEVSDAIGEPLFKCTGVPDADVTSQLLGVTIQGKQKAGGFAPPVRELPSSQLVPAKWEETASGDASFVVFRYKCGKGVYSASCTSHTNDAATVYLALDELPGGDVSITFGPLPSKEGGAERPKMQFALGKHVNLDGFQSAYAKGGSVSPTLFYVSLSELLGEFSSTFGVLTASKESDMPVEAREKTVPTVPLTFAEAKVNVPRPNVPPDGVAVDTDPHRDPLRVIDSHRVRGDFDADLLPGGPQPGGLHSVPHGGGMQVGPHHPLFDRLTGVDHDCPDGGFGGFGVPGGGAPPSFEVPGMGGMEMRPRFDPYGPPGGPTQPGRGGQFPGRGSRLGRGRGRGGRGPPGGSGNPNPDHMPPPGGDYFS
ncbi:hypothetical protein ACHAXT_012586 [Thalassiosira profunda]